MALDLMNRDPNDINPHLRSLFEDVFAEPEGTHSFDCSWETAFTCYSCMKEGCYKFLTCLCGLCIGMCWGCEFAGTAFNHVFCVTPCMRSCSVTCGTWQRFWGTCCTCLLAPPCEALGFYWSKINITTFKK